MTTTTTSAAAERQAPQITAVLWFSPQKFANAGVYIYGTADEIDQTIDDCDPYQSQAKIESRHRSLAAAQKAAEKYCRRDHRRHEAAAEDCYVGHAGCI